MRRLIRVTARMLDRMAGFGHCRQLASRPLFPPLVETCVQVSEATQAQLYRSRLTSSRSAALVNRARGTSSQVQRFWSDVNTPRGTHVEVTFKTKRRNGTIVLLMPLTGLPATFGRDPGRSATGSKPSVGT